MAGNSTGYSRDELGTCRVGPDFELNTETKTFFNRIKPTAMLQTDARGLLRIRNTSNKCLYMYNVESGRISQA